MNYVVTISLCFNNGATKTGCSLFYYPVLEMGTELVTGTSALETNIYLVLEFEVALGDVECSPVVPDGDEERCPLPLHLIHLVTDTARVVVVVTDHHVRWKQKVKVKTKIKVKVKMKVKVKIENDSKRKVKVKLKMKVKEP